MTRFERASGVLLPVRPRFRRADRRRGAAIRGLARDAGQRWWQMLPLGPPDATGPPTRPLGVRGLPSWSTTSGIGRCRRDRSIRRGAIRSGSVAGRRTPDRCARRSGPLRPGVGPLREHAADSGVSILGDIPFYVAPDSADHRGFPELFQRGVVGGVPPDDWSADRPALGQPGLRLERDAQRPVPLVGRAVPPHLGAGRRGPHRPLPWFRRLLRSPSDRTARSGTGAAARVARSSTPCRAQSRRGPGRRREPRRDHTGGGTAPRGPSSCRVRWCSSSCSPTSCEPTGRDRPDNVVYTGTHDNDTTNGWWSGASTPERSRVEWPRASRTRRCRTALDADPPRPRLPWRLGDRSRARPARSRLRCTDQRAGERRGQLRWRLHRISSIRRWPPGCVTRPNRLTGSHHLATEGRSTL